MTTVDAVRTGHYRVPAEDAHDDATQSFDALELVVVEVDVGDITGLGFTYTIGEGGAAVHGFVSETLSPLLIGGSAAPRTARERLRAGTTFVGREGVSELAVAAVDIALWDVLGKRRSAPLYELLGGSREPIPAYNTDGGWLQIDQETLVKNASNAADAGFIGVKMKVGRGLAADEVRVRAVRDALPAGTDLFLDGNCGYDISEAKRFANRIDDVDIGWFEEPLEKGDYAGYADLRGAVTVPIAAGENYYNPTQFKQALAAGALDVLQPDVCRVGGITPWLSVADLGDAWGIPVSPHYIEPIHVHLAAAAPAVSRIEHHSTVLTRVLDDPIEPTDGQYVPPTDPGHGVVFDGLDGFHVGGERLR
ncbi:mandelate racemase/muconate lactonizing enzyme family protein [Halarchaeum salinum]|uniref:Mandelate racemase/muconate lactonizing enzyme family protein n=1 Tax=Halarchaeum salinum TaxID=489912 RepID=A0AAV3SBL4_9EURY